MTYYKKLPVLDEKEQVEFDTWLKQQYLKDLKLATQIMEESDQDKTVQILGVVNDYHRSRIIVSVFDKLATPRIYLLQDWIHRKQQEKAGVETAESGSTFDKEKTAQ